MVNTAQRLEELRMQKGVSRPALAAALGLPRTAIEKFETGRQTPTQEQQKKLAAYFGVTVEYLRGENEGEGMTAWLSAADDEPQAAPVPTPKPQQQTVCASAGEKGDGAVFAALLKSDSFRALVQGAVKDVLRSPEGQALLQRAVRAELDKR